MTTPATRAAESIGVSEELFAALCEAICPPACLVESPNIGTRYPPNVRARALRIARRISDEALDAAVNGP